MSYNENIDPFEEPYEAPEKKSFPQKEGEVQIPGPLTLDSVTDKDGANYAIVKVKGYWDSFICDKGKFTAGQTLPDGLTLIGKASNNKQYPYRYSLAKPKTGGSFQGGGGGRSNWPPKSPEEFHAPSIGGIIKSCIEVGQDEAQAAAWIDLYLLKCKSAGK